jgi:filamentous hemagglutinin
MRSRMDKSSDSRTTTVASTVSAGKDVTLRAQTGDVAVQAATVDAGGSLTLSAAQGGVQILTARDSTAHSEDHSSTGMVWQSRKGSGKVDETTRYAALTAGGGITITAAKGVTAEIHTGGASLADTVAALAQKPDTAWIAQVAKRDDVTWKRVQEIHDQWDYKSQGLSGPASAVIAIAVAIATQGAGAGLLGAALGEGALTGAGGAMASAAFTSLVTQASLSLINNQGNLGAVLKDLGSSNALKSLAVSVASAGALNEVGTLTDGHFGADGLTTGDNLTPSQYFASNDYVLNVAGHAAVGCAAGAASGGDCGAGAVSGAASGAAGPFYVDSGVWGGTALAAATGGISSAAAGGEFADGAAIGAYGFLYNEFGGSIFGVNGSNQTELGGLGEAQSRIEQAKAATEPVLYAGVGGELTLVQGLSVGAGGYYSSSEKGWFLTGTETYGYSLGGSAYMGFILGGPHAFAGDSYVAGVATPVGGISGTFDNNGRLVGWQIATPGQGISGGPTKTCTSSYPCK